MTVVSHLLGHHGANPYFAFTDACNAARPVVILASGQACVWYRLALASKDGDWIAREDEASLTVIRIELARLGARYRLGAPLDVRWLSAGWSSHFEAIDQEGFRLRFDFVTRPPRLSSQRLRATWQAVEAGAKAVVSQSDLILLKQTLRLKDYAFIGALATQVADPLDQMRWTLDAQHLIDLVRGHPHLASRLAEERPALTGVSMEVDSLAAVIDGEIRALRRRDEQRIAAYTSAMQPWAEQFRSLDLDHVSLVEAHARCCAAASAILPTTVPMP